MVRKSSSAGGRENHRAILALEAGNLGDSRSLGQGLWERRLHFDSGYRLYFARDGAQIIILLIGGTKRRQEADIQVARGYLADYRQRRKDG